RREVRAMGRIVIRGLLSRRQSRFLMETQNRSEAWWDCGWIALAWAIPALILRPFQNTPFIDDWVYAWPVERLLTHGELQLLDFTGSLNHAQVIWGFLFCLPAGFSFTALRISTWALALVCLWFQYLWLRELQVARISALLGAATLALHPVFFVLSFTFM